MRVVWDPAKAKANFAKHGVRLSDAEVALFDPFGLTREDDSSEGEQRFVTIGTDASGKIVVVAFTLRGEVVRPFSSRKATKRERASYEKRIRLQ
jgi:uncharacterized DUF497 family protein